jgi:hypothetical protein
VWRAANAPVPPFDFCLTLDSFTRTLEEYQNQAQDRFDFSPVHEDLRALRDTLDRFYTGLDDLANAAPGDTRARAATAIQRQLARLLIPVNYAREGRFRQDPAQNIPALPDLAHATKTLAASEPGSHKFYAAQISLQRGVNRLRWTLRQARSLVERGARIDA